VKLWSRTVLAVYLLILLWLVLFKFSSDIFSVIAHHHATALNLIPFAGNRLREIFDNFIFFIPLGLLLGINYKVVSLKRKLAFVCIVSLVVEAAQFVLAIGLADITDVIMNTFGGLAGLMLYDVTRRRKYIKSDRLDLLIDTSITIIIAVLVAVFLYFRMFVLKVKY
jgi:glycopeptide antibiotics resistance protein